MWIGGWVDEIQRPIEVTADGVEGRSTWWAWMDVPPPVPRSIHSTRINPSVDSRGEEEVGDGLAPAGILE